MKRVVGNLMPLLKCPALVLWNVLGAVLCIPALVHAATSADPENGAIVAAYVLPGWSAFVLSSLLVDILHKPVSFCLPGHREVQRRTYLVVGVVASLVASLPVLKYPGLGGPSLPAALWSSFCFGLIVYLLVTQIQLLLRAAWTSVGIYVVVLFVLVTFSSVRTLAQDAALFAPAWNTLVLAALGPLAWSRLGSRKLARRICGTRFLSLQMAWQRSAAERFVMSARCENLSKGNGRLRRWLLRRLFNRIGRRPALSLRRHLAAAQYELMGYMLPLRPWTLPVIASLVLVLLVAAGYAPADEDRSDFPVANGLYILNCLIAMRLAVPLFTSMLLPAGRRERFWSALTFAVSGGLIVLSTSLLTYAICQGLGRWAPPLSMGGGTYLGVEILHFRPAQLGPILIPIAVVPMSMILKLTCKQWLLIPQILLFIIAAVIINRCGGILSEPGPATVILVPTVSWALLVGVLLSHCFRRDLVRM